MANTITTLAVNAAFLQEIKQDNEELRRAFREMANLFARMGADSVPPKALDDAVTNLRDQIAFHFALEEFYGYLDLAADDAIRPRDEADRLRSEHEILYLEICELVESVERWVYRESATVTAADLADSFSVFQARFEAHEMRENELIMAACDDLGVGD